MASVDAVLTPALYLRDAIDEGDRVGLVPLGGASFFIALGQLLGRRAACEKRAKQQERN